MRPEPDFRIVEAAAYLAKGRIDLAEAICSEVLRAAPNHAQAVQVMGLALLHKGQVPAALRLLRRSVALSPADGEFRANLGAALTAMGQFTEAESELSCSLELRPDHARTHANLAGCLFRQDKLEATSDALRASLALQEDLEVRTQLAQVLEKLGRNDAAESQFRKVLAADPNRITALKGLSVVLNRQVRQDQAISVLRHAVEVSLNDAALHSGMLYDMHYCPDITRQEHFEEHLRWAKRHEQPLRAQIRPHDNDRSPHRRLRVGYVSPDFRHHSAAAFFEPLLSHHDCTQVEVFCYFAGNRADERTKEFQALADVWRDIHNLDDDQAAKLIRSDAIDLLIDLTGHMAENRLLMFARQPAPIQIAYIGHPNTRGMQCMQYRLSDLHLDPPELQSDQFSSETIVRLPSTYACYQMPRANVAVSPLPARRNGFVTFGCLNNPAKLTGDTIALWCQIMKGLPNSRLILNADGSCRNLQTLFARGGIDVASRVRFTVPTTYCNYLQQFNQIDLALDPFPYNGHTTTCDGLWMGVPPLVLAGKTFASRTGVCILSQIGLPELIAHSPQELVGIAWSLAQNLPRLSALRESLRQRLSASTLTDGASLAREIEGVYRELWQKWCSANTVR